MSEREQAARYERTVAPHLAAAYNLARWLVRNEHDAEDVVQDAYLRAFRFFGGFNGINARGWLLTIVRHTAYSWLQEHRAREVGTVSDAMLHLVEEEGASLLEKTGASPEAMVLDGESDRLLRGALEELAVEYREAFVLREVEGLSYKEIADVTGIPMGTVMSRLSRARRELQRMLGGHLGRVVGT